MQYGWDVARDLKLGRAVTNAGGLASGLGYGASYDAVARMRGAEGGAGNAAGGSTQGTPLGSWTYGYGKADELVAITEASGGLQQYTSGAEGRHHRSQRTGRQRELRVRRGGPAHSGRRPRVHLGLARAARASRPHER